MLQRRIRPGLVVEEQIVEQCLTLYEELTFPGGAIGQQKCPYRWDQGQIIGGPLLGPLVEGNRSRAATEKGLVVVPLALRDDLSLHKVKGSQARIEVSRIPVRRIERSEEHTSELQSLRHLV